MAHTSKVGFSIVVLVAILNLASAAPTAPDDSKELRANCPQGYIGPIQHPHDCTKYINCTAEGESFEDCPEFNTFSPLLGICYYAYNVEAGCNGR